MSSVYRYRLFCETEQANVYTWNTLQPTICPNNNTHTINTESITVVDNINTTDTRITNFTLDNTDKLQTIQKHVVFNLIPFFGVTSLRNTIITSGSGTVTNNYESEIKINCSGANDSATLRSIQRGVYIPGLTCEAGIGIRLPSALTGNQVLKWGYMSNQNGFYFKLTSTDFQVCIMNNTVETCISRENFNNDRLDGNGQSGNLLDFSKGNIFHILFSWYGFGLVTFSILGQTLSSKQTTISIHDYQTIGHTSTRLPNLPIQIILNNNGTVANTDVFVAGRQFSVLGIYTPIFREITMHKYLFSISHETFLPIFSIKLKSEYVGCTVNISDIRIKSSVDCEVKILCKSNLTSSSWVENPYASESACLIDISSTAISDGIIIYSMICFEDDIVEHELGDHGVYLMETDALSISCKSLTGMNGSITCSLAYNEYW